MTRTLFGLLWFVSIGSTERSVDSGVECALFSWIDGQRVHDSNIAFEEYNQAWTSCDKNSDSYLSKEEVGAAIEQLQVGNNSYLEDMFGNQNFTLFEQQFKKIDNDSDGVISFSEFEMYYYDFRRILDAIDSYKDEIRKRPKLFS